MNCNTTHYRANSSSVPGDPTGTFEQREFPADRKRIDIGDFVTDDRRFRALTGWAPAVGLDDGLARSLDYYRRHLASYV